MCGVKIVYAAVCLLCLLGVSLASSCHRPTFTFIRDHCYTCVNESSRWSQIHIACEKVSAEVATIPSNYLLILTVRLCYGIATSHVWLMRLPSYEGNLTQAKNVTDERMATNGTSYCSALRMDVARIEQRPCYLQYPVLCKTNKRSETMEIRRYLMKRQENTDSNMQAPGNGTNVLRSVSGDGPEAAPTEPKVASTLSNNGSASAPTAATKPSTGHLPFANTSCDPFKSDCNFTCPSRRYGFNCTGYCSLKCQRQVCHSLTGDCIEGCVIGRSGLKCQRDCPNHCHDHFCDQKTATCTKGCEIGFTGQQCIMQCYNCAGNRSCMQYSGVCHAGCAEGFTGTTCSKAIVGISKDPLILIIVSIVGGSSLLLMLMIAGIRYRVCQKLPGRFQGSTGRNTENFSSEL